MYVLGIIGYIILCGLAVGGIGCARNGFQRSVPAVHAFLFLLICAIALPVSGASFLHAWWMIPGNFLVAIISALLFTIPTIRPALRAVASFYVGFISIGVPYRNREASDLSNRRAAELELYGKAAVRPDALLRNEVPKRDDHAEETQQERLVTPDMNWYVLRVVSDMEDSIRRTLLRKIKIEGFEHWVSRILAPTEDTNAIKDDKQCVVDSKLHPGYVFVEMRLDEDGRIPQDVFFLIKETPGVGDFIGTAGRPSPMVMPEIEKILLASKQDCLSI